MFRVRERSSARRARQWLRARLCFSIAILCIRLLVPPTKDSPKTAPRQPKRPPRRPQDGPR
eukprot:8931476-Pyramimonas_sp.AAC.1